jgi:hypothetical protein
MRRQVLKMTFKSYLALMLAAPAAIASSAHAGDVKGVVEIFTSQGCSSCRSADRTFSEVISQNGVLGLAWHVDYWDYLGWRDTFSSPQATARQEAYSKGPGKGRIYTPQVIVNGKTLVARSRSSSAIVSAMQGPLPVRVTIEPGGKGFVVEAGEGGGRANLVLVKFFRSKTVAIKRGENVGYTITYNHPVIDSRNIGAWNGHALRQELPPGECGASTGCAILLQRGGAGEILGAAML